MRNLYTFCLALFLSSQSFAQVVVGEGTSTHTGNGPIDAYYTYSYFQTIYRAQDINASGTITSIQYEMEDEDPITNSDDQIDVWVGHTSKTKFETNTDWISTGDMTQVVTNGTAIKSGTTVTITFDTPFTYNGTDNLVIAVDANEGNYDTNNDKFYYSVGEEKVTILFHSDSNNPDPNDLSTIGYSYITQSYPNIVINGITQSCPKPTGLTADNITGDSAVLSWTQAGSTSDWTLEYGPTGFTPGNGTIVNVTSTPYTLTGLTPATHYDFYVKANCTGESSYSNGPATFTTSCVTITTEYNADFSVIPPLCWSQGNGAMGGAINYGESKWRANRAFTNTNGEVIQSNGVNLYTDTTQTWLVSNSFDLDADDFTLETTVAAVSYKYSGTSAQGETTVMGADDKVYLLISNDDGTTWTELAMWDVNNQPEATGTTLNIDLSNYSGIAKFAFFATDGDIDNTEDYDFLVGKFKTTKILAVDDVKNNNSNFEFYPNPVNNFLFIKGEQKVSNVKIYDVTGKMVYQNKFDKNIAEINVSSLISGQYIVNAEIDGVMQNFKIMKR